MSVALKKLAPTDLAQQWATRINRQIGAAVEAILAIGRELTAAKAALKHGEWERMFSGHAQSVDEPVSFTVQTARKLMAVSDNAILSNRAHVRDLPPSWGTLYELTKLSAPTLRAALADGRIHPDLERREVTALRGEAPTQAAPTAKTWDFADGGERLRHAAEAEFSRWGAGNADRERVAYLLRQIAKETEVPE